MKTRQQPQIMQNSFECDCNTSQKFSFKLFFRNVFVFVTALLLVQQTFANNIISTSPSTTVCSGTTVELTAGTAVDIVDWYALNGTLLLANSNTYSFVFTGNISVVVTVTLPNLTVLRDTVVLTLDTGDSDSDGVPNCSDGCPGDPNKIDPGICGCGASDADFDGDGVPNCVDGCPTDPNKTIPGVCGCGVPDINTDGDLLPDCFDQCPLDPNKLFPGACGCGVPETDSDGDGVPNCIDGCPFNAAKIAPGVCGCGIQDIDSDGDGVLNCFDGCPFDTNKIAPGQCGCGNPDVDSDGDGIADCNDGCPNDVNKTSPGICGCGISDADNDNDGVPNCNDLCPNDPNKVDPGICGCGRTDADDDNDGVANCNDGCPNDANKTTPGICGCGVADTDTDNDGRADCNDGCPLDPNKITAGVCGCGVSDIDSDNDGIADCNDGCPNDPDKIAPGLCGCGVSDIDSDNDGTPNCNDLCPNDPNKVASGQCGCGIADTDTDNDGVANCNDGCPNNPNKTTPGICGCAVSDVDTDNDGVADCNDLCPNDFNKTTPGTCGCGIPDTDSDSDGIPDCIDDCPFGPLFLDVQTTPSVCGPDGTTTVTVTSGGSGSYTYQWNNGGTNDVISGLFPGTFRVTVSDVNTGCSDSINAVVNPFPGSLFVLGFDSAGTSCLGGNDGSATAIISGGIGPFTYLWTNGATTQTITNVSAGIYAVTVTDQATGCTGFDDVRITDAAPYIVDLGTDKVVCPGDAVTLNVGNAINANWFLANGTLLSNNSLSYSFNPVTAQSIVVQGFSAGGCVDFDTLNIIITSIDSDNDGTPDCIDGCPIDPNKIAPGSCGCGIADTDSDNDGTPDCFDECPFDPNKTQIGFCGCGFAEGDSDNDGIPNCADNCPNDSNKVDPGICGCGTADTDNDNDGTPNCNDLCPFDPNKVAPGICGCGTPDTDTDGDGRSDCFDQCPLDPLKFVPGICGCGVSDVDSDGDGTPNCNDQCPNDPNKIVPGICGCGTPETDSDGDGIPNCIDGCPNDPNKIAPGLCGCGVPDVDNDGDGTPNCNDGCPNDPNKIAPGQCGCGVVDTDTDSDGIADCVDACPVGDLIVTPGAFNAICGADGRTNISVSGSSGSFSYFWSNGATTQNLLNVFPATYTVTITDNIYNTCSEIISVTVNPAPNAFAIINVVSQDVRCFNESNGSISFQTQNATGPITYNWTPNVSSSNSATNLSAGNYTVLATNVNTGCTSQVNVTINQPALYTINLGNDRLSCNNVVESFSVSNADSVNWYSANGTLLRLNNNSYSFNFFLTTSIVAEAFNAAGCVAYDTITVFRDSLDADGDGEPNCSDLCLLDPNKVAPGVCGCGNSDIDSDSDGTPDCDDLCPSDPDRTIPGLCGCGFPETDTDNDGTPDCNDFCVSDPNKTVPGICGCGITETDSDGDGVPDCIDFCPNDPNKTVPGICGCGIADADSDGDGVIDCNDGCPFDGTKTNPGICGCGVPDIDSDGDGAADCIDLCPNDPNKTEPGLCGCGNTDNFVVGAGANQFICRGNAAILEASGGTDYLWDNGVDDAINVVFPTADTTKYFVTVSNGTCTATDSVLVILLPKPNIFAGKDDTICAGSSYTLKATGGIVYSWNNGGSDSLNTVIITQDTEFDVIGFDANGCFNRDTVMIYVLPAPVTTASNDTVICSGNPLTLSASGGNKYLWNTGDTIASINIIPFSTATYSVTITGVNGCASAEQINVTVKQSPVVDAGPNYITCESDIRTLQGSSSDNYLWSTGETSAAINVNPVATTKYYLSATNIEQCTAIDSTTIFVNPLPIVNAGNDTSVCIGDAITLQVGDGVLFRWSTGDTTRATTFVPLQSQQVSVVVTDSNGCVNADIVNVTVNLLPEVDAGNNREICKGDAAVLFASGAENYVWSNGQTAQAFTDTPQNTKEYIVVGIDANGCAATASVVITVNDKPEIIIDGETKICLGGNIELTALGGVVYVWNETDTVQTFVVEPTTNSTYRVEVIDTNGCSNTKDVSVVVNEIFNSEILGLDTFYCMGRQSVFLESFPSGGVFSGNGVDSNIFSPQEAGEGLHTITYVFTDSRGCISNATQNVTVQICAGTEDLLNEKSVKVYPNPFNDAITISFEGYSYEHVQISLYDVSGKQIMNMQQQHVDVNNAIQLSLQHLEAGTYLLQVKQANATETIRIVKTE